MAHAENSGIVAQLSEKYRLQLERAQINSKATKHRSLYSSDLILFLKWAHRVGKGWYGFDLGCIPPVWTNMIHDFFVWLETACPDFEIHQVKIKGTGIRIYLGTKTDFIIPDERIRAEIRALEELLSLRPSVPPSDGSAKKPIRKSLDKS